MQALNRRHVRAALRATGVSMGLALLVSLGAASPATAISDYNIQLGAGVVRAMGFLTVKVTGLYDATACQVSLVGPAKTKPVAARVRNGAAVIKLRVPPAPLGEYRVKASCGKDGTALSEPVIVVGKNSPLRASCEVVEYGFTSEGYYANFGAIVANRSPELGAASVELSLTFKDSSGSVVSTATSYVKDIPPGTTVLNSISSTKAFGATSLTVLSACKTSGEVVDPVISGRGAITSAEESYGTMEGQFVNTVDYTIASGSDIALVFRNPAGVIIGGGRADTEAFTPSGTVATWDRSYWPLPVPADSQVESMLFPERMT